MKSYASRKQCQDPGQSWTSRQIARAIISNVSYKMFVLHIRNKLKECFDNITLESIRVALRKAGQSDSKSRGQTENAFITLLHICRFLSQAYTTVSI